MLLVALFTWRSDERLFIKKKLGAEIMRGVIAIDVLVFTIYFIVMAVFAFLPPIVLSGLIALFLTLALVAVLKSSASSAAK